MAYPTYPYQPYNPYYYQPTVPQQTPLQPPQPAQMPAQSPQPQQIQNGGFVSVRAIEDAYNWPIAPGVGMTFKVENAPIIIDKSRGFSPLEQPVVKVYDMIERVAQPQTAPSDAQEPIQSNPTYAERADIDAIRAELDSFRADLEAIKNQPLAVEIKRPTTKPKKEADE